MNTSPEFLVLIGPSGVGKTSVAVALQDRHEVTVIPSWTTRPPRPYEQSGQVDHIFTSEAEFSRKEQSGFFLEALPMFGLPYRYGLPAMPEPTIGGSVPIPVVLLRTPLIPLLQKHYSRYVIYAITDTPDRIQARLQTRQADGEPLGDRIASINDELAQGSLAAYRSFDNNDTIEHLVDRIIDALHVDFSSSQ